MTPMKEKQCDRSLIRNHEAGRKWHTFDNEKKLGQL